MADQPNPITKPPKLPFRITGTRNIYTHRCEIWPSIERFDDAGGEYHDFPSPREVDVPCLVIPASTQEVENFGRIGMLISHMVHFNRDPMVKPTDRIVYEGRNLDVQHSKNEQEMDVAWAVACREHFGHSTQEEQLKDQA